MVYRETTEIRILVSDIVSALRAEGARIPDEWEAELDQQYGADTNQTVKPGDEIVIRWADHE